MNSGVTTQAAGGIQVAVPVTGHRDNAVIAESGMTHVLMDIELRVQVQPK
jgi:hypothetical protein